MLEVVEKAFAGYRADGDDREYAALPNVFFDDGPIVPPLDGFCEALLARCNQLRERYPNCLTWPAPGPPARAARPEPLRGGGRSDMPRFTPWAGAARC